MQDIKINSPAISNFYKGVAGQIQAYIPREYGALELAAASTTIAQRLAGDAEPDYSHFRQAVQIYLQELPNDTDLAVAIVKQDAGKVLGIPQLASDFEKLTIARAALAEAEAAIAEAEAEQGKRLQRIYHLDSVIATARGNLDGWDIDFDGIEAHAEATILERFGTSGPGAPYDIPHVNNAFYDLSRIPTLRKLAPAAVAKLQATIATAEEELTNLRAAAAEVEAEPVKLTRGRQKLAFEEGEEPT